MNLPAVNPSGYVTASISNVTGFNNVDYLIAHGSGDDNVHFANAAHLLDMFTQHHVRNFRFRMFTDRCVGDFVSQHHSDLLTKYAVTTVLVEEERIVKCMSF